MRPSQYHYLKRMWTRNLLRRSSSRNPGGDGCCGVIFLLFIIALISPLLSFIGKYGLIIIVAFIVLAVVEIIYRYAKRLSFIKRNKLCLRIPSRVSSMIQKFMYFLKLDKTTEENLYRPEPYFKTAVVKGNITSKDKTILNNLCTIIQESSTVSSDTLPDMPLKMLHSEVIFCDKDKVSEKLPTFCESDKNIEEQSDSKCENNSIFFDQAPIKKPKSPSFNFDVFLWQCNSVCKARDDNDYQLDMHLDNPEDRLEAGYYYAMKDISDEKKERMCPNVIPKRTQIHLRRLLESPGGESE